MRIAGIRAAMQFTVIVAHREGGDYRPGNTAAVSPDTPSRARTRDTDLDRAEIVTVTLSATDP
jgi:hypothetical protein